MGARYQSCAGTVAVNTELPAREVFAIFRRFCQGHAAGIQLVCKADRNCAACGDGNFLGIGTGTVVQCIDGAVSVAQFLHIIGACSQVGDGDLTAGICGKGACCQGRASTVGVDAKLPSG